MSGPAPVAPAPITRNLRNEIKGYETIPERARLDGDMPKVRVTRQVLDRLYTKAILAGGHGE